MAKVVKLSVTVDSATLDEVRRLAPDVTISFLVDSSLKQKLGRLRLSALLDEMDAERPMSEEGRKRGEALWEEAESSWTRERSLPLQKATKSREASSGKRSKTKRKSSSRPS